MKLSTNLIVQFLSTALQFGNLISGALPPKAQPWAALGIGIIQTVTAWISHYHNTDGTSQAVAKVG